MTSHQYNYMNANQQTASATTASSYFSQPPNMNVNSSQSSTPDIDKQLNSATLSKALTKPPSLSSILNPVGGIPRVYNPGSLNGLPPMPSLMQQQSMPAMPIAALSGSNLIAQSKKAAEPATSLLPPSMASLNLNHSSASTPPSSLTPNASTNNLLNASTNSSGNSSLLDLNNSNGRTATPPVVNAAAASSQINFSNSMPSSSSHLFQQQQPSKHQMPPIRPNLFPQPVSTPSLVSSNTPTMHMPPNLQSSQPALGTPFIRSLDTNASQQMFSANNDTLNKFSPTPTPLSTPFPSSNALFNQQQQQTTNLLAQTSQALANSSSLSSSPSPAINFYAHDQSSSSASLQSTANKSTDNTLEPKTAPISTTSYFNSNSNPSSQNSKFQQHQNPANSVINPLSSFPSNSYVSFTNQSAPILPPGAANPLLSKNNNTSTSHSQFSIQTSSNTLPTGAQAFTTTTNQSHLNAPPPSFLTQSLHNNQFQPNSSFSNQFRQQTPAVGGVQQLGSLQNQPVQPPPITAGPSLNILKQSIPPPPPSLQFTQFQQQPPPLGPSLPAANFNQASPSPLSTNQFNQPPMSSQIPNNFGGLSTTGNQPPFQQAIAPPTPSMNRPPPTMADIISQNKQQQQQQQIPPTPPSSLNSQQQQFYQQQPQYGQQNQFQSQIPQQTLTQNQYSINNLKNRGQPQAVDLLKEKKLIVSYECEDEVPRPLFQHGFYTQVNCHQDLVRCTLTSIPETQAILNKCRLPLGILIHPFKDLESLKVVQSSIIVRCRSCRSYINPYVHFLENSKWRCNMCYSINDVPDEFLYDPVTKSYGDPSKRPEINSATIEFIAPPEYTLRPPPPAMYLYLLDVSRNALNTGYLANFCETLAENLEKIPGDARAQVGFITYSSSIHFYNMSDALSQPRMMIYPDLDELILPMPDSLMVNLHENRESIANFLQSMPSLFNNTFETDSALGSALQAAYHLLKTTGGRISVFQTCLPNSGLGSLKPRSENVDKDSASLAPQIDYYKQFALDCATVHIAVDLFMLNSLYADLATLSCVSKYSGGEVKYYPGYHSEDNPEQVIRFCVDLKRYLTRKIGFEAVMRIRCTRGLAIHTFHGNFFVRSTDLLALPNVNPDAGFGMQINIEEPLSDVPSVCFQAAILYTSSRSERRIRIHTYCLPVSKNVNEIVNGADQEAIIGLIAKMAVDRTSLSTLKEAKDAMMNVAADYLQAYSQHLVSSNKGNAILSPYSLRLIPTYVLALMKNIAFKFGANVKIDDRVYAMNLCKTMPLKYLMSCIYPNLYAVHNLDDKKKITDSSDTEVCIPPRLNLSSEHVDRHGVYIMDCGEAIYMWIGKSVSDQFLQQVFDVKSFNELPDHSNDLPELENPLSERIRNFLLYLYDNRPFGPTFIYFREDSPKKNLFFQHMHDDKTESSVSYYEFLRYLIDQINS